MSLIVIIIIGMILLCIEVYRLGVYSGFDAGMAEAERIIAELILEEEEKEARNG